MVSHDLSGLVDIQFEWPELKTLGGIVSFRTEKGGQTEAAFRFYSYSARLCVDKFYLGVREYWLIGVLPIIAGIY